MALALRNRILKSLYADDVLFYITSPRLSIPSILKELNIFGHLSNFKVNLTKLYILNISLPSKEFLFDRNLISFSSAGCSCEIFRSDDPH